MEIPEIRRTLEEMPEKIYEAEVECAKAESTYNFLKKMEKPILSRKKESYSSGSNPEKETKAYASQEYVTHLNGVREADLLAGKAKAEVTKRKNILMSAHSLKALLSNL